MKVFDVVDRFVRLGDGRRDGEPDLLVRKLDRQLELLRRVHRIERQRALGLAQRRAEIAQIREREAQIVVRFGKIRIRLNGARKRVSRVGVLLQLYEYEPDPIPRHRMLGRGAQNLPVRFERQVDVFSPEQAKREIEPRFDRRRRRLERAPECVDRVLGVALVPDENANVVVRERIARVDLQGAIVALLGFGVPALELERYAAPIPGLGRRREFAREPFGGCYRRARVALKEIELEHRLQHFRVRFSAFNRFLVFPERFLEVSLLPQRAAERDVRPGGSSLLVAGRDFVTIGLERKICLSANERRIEHDGAPVCLGGLVAASKIAQYEPDQIKSVRILRIELDGAAHRAHRIFVQPTVVESLGQKEV